MQSIACQPLRPLEKKIKARIGKRDLQARNQAGSRGDVPLRADYCDPPIYAPSCVPKHNNVQNTSIVPLPTLQLKLLVPLPGFRPGHFHAPIEEAIL